MLLCVSFADIYRLLTFMSSLTGRSSNSDTVQMPPYTTWEDPRTNAALNHLVHIRGGSSSSPVEPARVGNQIRSSSQQPAVTYHRAGGGLLANAIASLTAARPAPNQGTMQQMAAQYVAVSAASLSTPTPSSPHYSVPPHRPLLNRLMSYNLPHGCRRNRITMARLHSRSYKARIMAAIMQ